MYCGRRRRRRESNISEHYVVLSGASCARMTLKRVIVAIWNTTLRMHGIVVSGILCCGRQLGGSNSLLREGIKRWDFRCWWIWNVWSMICWCWKLRCRISARCHLTFSAAKKGTYHSKSVFAKDISTVIAST